MATKIIEAFFTANQNIDIELEEAEAALQSLNSELGELQRDMAQSAGWTDNAEEKLDEFNKTVGFVQENADKLETRLDGVERALLETHSAGDVTDRQIGILGNTMMEAYSQSEKLDDALGELESEMAQTAAKSDITDNSMESLARSMRILKEASGATERGMSSIQRSAIKLYGAMTTVEESVDDFSRSLGLFIPPATASMTAMQGLKSGLGNVEDEAEEASDKIQKLSLDLSILGAVANSSAFEMGNLSINIGPFNLALQNLLFQLPAIITGMGTVLALVTSLATAFLTLAAAMGALFIGGALAWFEDFSKQFEDSAKAVEALMGALKDLFIDAMEPLMTDANMDLFIEAIEGAARVVNMFAQFFSQMRGDIMRFLDGVGGDMGAFFEALHDSFEIVKPVLQDFINFFINELPGILVQFALFTESISGDIGKIVDAFGRLINELLEIAPILASGLGPIIVGILTLLSMFFEFINYFEDGLASLVVSFIALSLVLGKVTVAMAGWIGSVSTASAAIAKHIVWQQSLTGTMWATISSIRASIAQWFANTAAKITNFEVTNALTVAMARQSGIIAALAADNIILRQAVLLSAKSMYMFIASIVRSIGALIAQGVALVSTTAAEYLYTAGAYAAGTATWFWAAAVNALAAPLTVTIALILGIIAVMAIIAGWNPFEAIVEGLKDASELLDRIISKMGIIPGLGGGGMGDAEVLDQNDISSNPNVDLSFQDNIEQNVDVDADPEEKETMKRLVKDAMNEANSIARRQDGSGQ